VPARKIVKIAGSHYFNAPRDRVWETLLDPEVIAQCVPGCERLKKIAPDQYEATIKQGIGGIESAAKGKIVFKEKRRPSHYIISGEGSGGPGFLQGDVVVDLEAQGDRTLLRFKSDATVGGLSAGIGQRMVEQMAKVMLERFFKKIAEFV
jgi:carbon monoxide dehydrogenase subunit G